MSEFRPPPVRSMEQWDAFCDATGQPRPAQQLADARAAGDTWLADRIEKTILRCGGEIPRIQYGVERLDPATITDAATGDVGPWSERPQLWLGSVRDWADRPAYSRRLWAWLVAREHWAIAAAGIVVALIVGILLGRA